MIHVRRIFQSTRWCFTHPFTML